jgi:hypothetical protein
LAAFDPAFEDAVKRFAEAGGRGQDVGCRMRVGDFAGAGLAPVNHTGQHAPREQIVVIADLIANDGAGLVAPPHGVDEIEA